VTAFLAKTSTPLCAHPPYSPDLAPNDFFLFPKLERELKGTRFESLEAVKRAMMNALKAIPETDFKGFMENTSTALYK